MFKLRTHPAVQLLCLGSLLTAMSAAAEERVTRDYSFDLSGIREIEFHASVGSLRILPADGEKVELVLAIEGKDGGWFRGTRDVSDVELLSEVRGDRLILEQTEEHTNTEWTVRLPAVALTTIDMGVGEIVAEFNATELSIELGVGDVEVSAPLASAGRVDLEVGVGEATLKGGRRVETQRRMVSQQVHGEGEGALDIDIDNGVGNIDLELF